MKKVYLSGTFSNREEWRELAEMLTSQGWEITSNWLQEPTFAHDDLSPDNIERQKRASANEDIEDIWRADAILAFVTPPSTTGGFDRELGMAIAIQRWAPGRHDYEIFVIGGEKNVFDHLSSVEVYDTFAEFMLVMGLRWELS